MGKRLHASLVFGLIVSIAVVGCSSTKKKTGATPASKPGVTDEGLAREGSLERYRRTGSPEGEEGRRGGEGEEGGPLRDIRYAFDSHELDEASRTDLRDNAAWLKDRRAVKIEVEGHCDERGTVEYNLALGAKRARAAKDYLAALGVAADRMSTISYGEELPLCHDHDENCWERNRRAHFVVLGE